MKHGFTLIEVLVVIFIVGILSTILIVNWRNNEKTYLVQRTAQEIAQNVHRIQDMALSGKIYSPEIKPYPYGVNFSTGTKNSYVIFADKNGNGTYQTPPSDLFVETVSLDPDVEIYSLTPSSGGVLNITFSIPDGFTVISPSATSAIVKIRKVGTTCTQTKNCRTITITNAGGVTIE